MLLLSPCGSLYFALAFALKDVKNDAHTLGSDARWRSFLDASEAGAFERSTALDRLVDSLMVPGGVLSSTLSSYVKRQAD